MPFRFGLGWHVALVVALFVGSLAAMLFSSWTAFGVPWHEERARDEVRQASRRLAEAAAENAGVFPPVDDRPPREPERRFREVDRRFHEIAQRALQDSPGVEGGFYLSTGDGGVFLGYAYPGRQGPPPPHESPPDPPPERPEPPPDWRGPPPGKHKGPPPPPDYRDPLPRDPPPQERRFVLQQVQGSLGAPPGAPPPVQVLDVGPSRVAIAAEAVGDRRPARLAAWVMKRITGPEQQREQLHRYQASAGLALGGIALSLVLTANLVRTLRRERRQQESLREDLRRAENLAALGRLLAGVAHEVRNPLAAIRSTVQLWQRLPDRARTPASMEAVIGSVDRLNDLVSRLLYFARSGHDARAPVDVNALVRDALELVRAQADGQKVTLAAELDPHLPTIHGSAQALQQVLLNLAANALQAMPAGGRLTCVSHWLPEEGQVELRVKDTGPGVPASARDRLFEPFFTTRTEGTGLGLALCREIVRQHGGRIDLADSGTGAEFVVRLPRGKPDREAAP